jgi:hypothetical protein
MANYHHPDTAGKIKTDVGFLQFDSLYDDLAKLRSKGDKLKIVDNSVTNIGITVNKRPIQAIKIGRNPDKRVLIVGCHHAREWISVEIPYLVAKYLIDNYKEKKDATTDKEKRINYLVDNAEIWIVPLLNPDGHAKTFKKDESFWRANRNQIKFASDTTIERWTEKAPYHTEKRKDGPKEYELKFFRLDPTKGGTKHTITIKKGVYEGVDLNRNYPAPKGAPGAKEPPWGVETHGDVAPFTGGLVEYQNTSDAADKGSWWSLTSSREPDPPDTFCGPSAGSEKEVDAIVKLLDKGNFKIVVSYHNYSKLILFPTDAEKDADIQFLGKGMEELYKDRGDPHELRPSSKLYVTSGDTKAWLYRVHKIPCFTIELAPSQKDAKDKKWMFNRLPPSEIEPTFEVNLPAALCAINCAISGFKPAKAAAPAKPVVAAVLNCWEQLKGWKP